MLFDIINTYDDKTIAHLKQVWEDIIIELAKQEDAKKIVSFLGKCCVLWIDETKQKIHIGIPNDFVASQVEKFFKKSLQKAMQDSYDNHYSPNFVIYTELQSWEHQLQTTIKHLLPQGNETPTFSLEEPTISKELSDHFGILFDPQYTFARFIVWSYNELAYSAWHAIAQKPWEVYNPFFIYGNVWLGKTHLMQAIGNYIIEHDKNKVVLYLPTSTLIDKIIEWVKKWTLAQLQQKLQDVDVLMLDDIQFLAWKERTQEIFHNIFNEFYTSKRQIILTSDRAPKELTTLEARLQTRFALGVVADIKQPDLETRIAILQAKIAEKWVQLDPEHIELIAQTVQSNIRELEWALNIIATRSTLLNKPISQNDIIDALSTLGYKQQRTSHHQTQAQHVAEWFDGVVTHIANHYGLLVSDMIGTKRTQDVSRARQLAMYIAKTHFQWSLQKIWAYFWWKNHATVIYAIETATTQLNEDKHLQKYYTLLIKTFDL